MVNKNMEKIAVLSLLEGESSKGVRQIWDVLEDTYGLRGVKQYEYPHLTFAIAECTEVGEEIIEQFEEVASSFGPFEIEVTGVDHFERRVLYFSVEKTEPLLRINSVFAEFLEEYCLTINTDYSPQNWVPHISLIVEELKKDVFDGIWESLKGETIHFTQTVHNISLVRWEGDEQITQVKRLAL